jgi:hypothetical protein
VADSQDSLVEADSLVVVADSLVDSLLASGAL